jgi:hypothetical protein
MSGPEDPDPSLGPDTVDGGDIEPAPKRGVFLKPTTANRRKSTILDDERAARMSSFDLSAEDAKFHALTPDKRVWTSSSMDIMSVFRCVDVGDSSALPLVGKVHTGVQPDSPVTLNGGPSVGHVLPLRAEKARKP